MLAPQDGADVDLEVLHGGAIAVRRKAPHMNLRGQHGDRSSRSPSSRGSTGRGSRQYLDIAPLKAAGDRHAGRKRIRGRWPRVDSTSRPLKTTITDTEEHAVIINGAGILLPILPDIAITAPQVPGRRQPSFER